MIILHQMQGSPGGLLLDTLSVGVVGDELTVKGAVSIGPEHFDIDVTQAFDPETPGGLYIHADGRLTPELGPLVIDQLVWWDAEGVHAKTPADPDALAAIAARDAAVAAAKLAEQQAEAQRQAQQDPPATPPASTTTGAS